MRHIAILSILLTSALIASCTTEDTLVGSGNLITESREVELFRKVSSEGVFDLKITQGNAQSVEIKADDNIINRIRTKVIDDELQLYLDDDLNYSGITVEVSINATQLNGLTNSGIGNMTVSNVEQSGTFSIANFGTGNISIAGSAPNLNIVNEGSGDISAFGFFVENCSVDITGSGSVDVNCSENLNVKIDGSGNVHYKGNPAINASIEGSGRVIDAN